jgi:GTPase
MSDKNTHCGFVTIIGAPNVGKSTLVNRLVGTKVSIVSSKVQTTRSRILGIFIEENTQVLLVDTPGIFKPSKRLERAMVAAAWTGTSETDFILLLVDGQKGIDENTESIIKALRKVDGKKFVAINKVDRAKKADLLGLAAELDGSGLFAEIFMISALTGDGVGDIKAFFAKIMPPGPWLYPEDHISDMPQRLWAAEITREKLFQHLHQELPYGLCVETESWTEKKDHSLDIRQVIYVEKKTHKGIVLGQRGKTIKSLGTQSRLELESALGCRVHLFLFVKVKENWKNDPEQYRNLGLDFNA